MVAVLLLLLSSSVEALAVGVRETPDLDDADALNFGPLYSRDVIIPLDRRYSGPRTGDCLFRDRSGDGWIPDVSWRGC